MKDQSGRQYVIEQPPKLWKPNAQVSACDWQYSTRTVTWMPGK